MSLDQNPHLSCLWGDPHDWDLLSAATVPNDPGFYAFTNHADVLQAAATGKKVLYIGIATQSLRERIRKYKTGDFTNINALHRGGFMMFLSRADSTLWRWQADTFGSADAGGIYAFLSRQTARARRSSA